MQKLKKLGLSEYEIKVYEALLKNGAMRGGEITKKSQVPHGKTYETLEKLEKKGFVIITPIKPKLFSSVEPKKAIQEYINLKKKELDSFAQESISQLKSLPKGLPKDQFLERVKITSGTKESIKLHNHLFDNAKKEIKYMVTYEYYPEAHKTALQTSIERGIKVKILATKMDKNALYWAKKDLSLGAEVRYAPIEEIRIQVKDDDEARILILNPNDKRDRINVFFEHGEMAKVLSLYFDTIWKKAKRINSKIRLNKMKNDN